MKQSELNKKRIIDEIRSLAEKLNRKPVKRDDERLYQIARKYFKSWNNSLKLAGFEIKDKQSPIMPDTKENGFYYFLGLLITDGHVVYDRGKNYQIKLYTSYEEEKEMIAKLIYFLFNYKPSIRKRKTGFSKRANYEIYISSKDLCNFITNFSDIPSGAKSINVKVPNLLLSSDKSKIGGFIRGVIDGDGTILKSSTAKIVSGSEGFLSGVKELLNKLGAKSGKICHEKENLYTLWICGKDNLRKLRGALYENSNSFFYSRKKDLWNQYI